MLHGKYLSYVLRPSFAFRRDDPNFVDHCKRVIVLNPGRMLQIVELTGEDPIKRFILTEPDYVVEYGRCEIEDWLTLRIEQAKKKLNLPLKTSSI